MREVDRKHQASGFDRLLVEVVGDPSAEFALELTKGVRRMVLDGLNEDQIKHQSLASGFVTLRKSGVKKILDGVTTVDEVRAATLADHI